MNKEKYYKIKKNKYYTIELLQYILLEGKKYDCMDKKTKHKGIIIKKNGHLIFMCNKCGGIHTSEYSYFLKEKFKILKEYKRRIL